MFKFGRHIELFVSAQLLLACSLSCLSMVSSPSARAQQAGNAAPAQAPSQGLPLELDLSSQTASISGALLGHNEVEVNFAGASTTVNSSSLLTPAQYLAALSVVSGGQQTLQVNSSGQAVSGSFQLPTGASLASVLVPSGITGVYDFAGGQNLNLSGNFTNSGAFYLVSSTQSLNSGSLSALNIVNNSGALLSSVLPASGLAGFNNLVSNLSFNLNAVNNLTNFGTIASAGSLNITAGNQILNGASSNILANISAMTSLSMIAPSIINQGNIGASLASLNVQTANLVNSGLLKATNGDMSISNLASTVLNVSNSGGLIAAHNLLEFANSAGRNSSIVVDGGVLAANSVIFDNELGTVSVSVEDLPGNLTFSTRYLSLDVENGSHGLNLSGLSSLRSVALSYNGAGDIISSGFNSRGQDLFINTNGSVHFSSNINTRSNRSGEGGSVYINAAGNVSLANITSNGRRDDGGSIFVSSGQHVSAGNLTANGNAGGDGGAVSVFAAGNLSLNNISANGAGGGNGGSVRLVSGEHLSVNNISNKGAGGGSGGLVYASSGGNLALNNVTSSGSSGGSGGAIILSAGEHLSARNLVTNGAGGGSGGLINLSAGANLSAFNISANGAGGGDGGYITASAGEHLWLNNVNSKGAGGGSGGDVLLIAGSNLSLRNLNSSGTGAGDGGSAALLAGGEISTRNLVLNGGPDGSGDSGVYQNLNGNGGNLLIAADGNISTGTISSTGSGSAGSISISSKSQVNTAAITSKGVGDGSGGPVTISAQSGINAGDITSAGAGSGNGGNIILNSGSSINAEDLNASGGKSGEPGAISIIAGGLGTGNVNVSSITDNGAAGGGSVTISAPNAINIAGAINAVDGSISLDSATSSIGDINIGTGQLNINNRWEAGSTLVLDLGQLVSYGAENLSISGSANIVLSSNCNQCFASLDSLTLNTTGSFTATGTLLTLADGQSFTVNAASGINTGSVSSDGGNLAFVTQGALTVDGGLNLSNGNLHLEASSFSINAPVDAGSGSVTIEALTQTNLSGSQLANISASVLNLSASSPAAGISISGTTNLSAIASQVNVSIPGAFDSSNASLLLASQSFLNIDASQVNLGRVQGGNSVTANSQGQLQVTGSISTNAGAIVLNADLAGSGAALSLRQGVSISADSISMASGAGDIISGASLIAREGNIDISAGSALSLLNNSHLSAASDLNLSSGQALSIGSGSQLRAGSFANQSFNPFASRQTFDSHSIGSSGSVYIDSYRGGSATGSVSIGSGVSIIAAGENGAGSLGILSGDDIIVGSGAGLAAVGGNLWLSAASDVEISGADIVSLSSNAASSGSPYSGGQIAVMAGAPDTDMPALLAALVSSRNASQQIRSDISLAGNFIGMHNGSLLSVIQPADHLISLGGNQISLNGGVLFIDPPPSSTVTINNSNITAVGPGISSSPLVINPNSLPPSQGQLPTIPPASNNTVNSGAGGLNIGTSAAIMGGAASISSSSVNQTDLQNRSISLDQSQAQSQGRNASWGQAVNPLDTLDDPNPSKNGFRSAIFCSKPQLLRSSDISEEDSWIIASSSCQPFTFEEHDGSLIVGTGPAKLAPAQDRTLLLREGKILVITTDKIHVVRTPFCNITVPVNTAAVVEVDAVGIVRVANLAGGKASVTICRSDETLILSAAPGEQLVLAESGVPEQQFSAVSYSEVSHSKVASWNLELAGLRGQKIRFDRQEMAQHEDLLHCSMGCVSQAQLRRLQQLIQSMTSEGQVSLKSMKVLDKGRKLIEGPPPLANRYDMLPVSFNDGKATELSFNSLNAGSALVKYTGRCKLSLAAPGLICFEDGEALVAASKKTIIKSGDAKIELKPGTLAVVAKKDGTLCVRNIYEKKSCAVLTTVGQRVIGLQVAQELLLGPKGISLSRALSRDAVGRRRVQSLDLKSGHTCISSEISLSSLMQNSPILTQLLRSADSADRQIASRLMKMSVCVTLATSSHGNYSMMSP